MLAEDTDTPGPETKDFVSHVQKEHEIHFLGRRVGPSRFCTQKGHMSQLGHSNILKGAVMLNISV